MALTIEKTDASQHVAAKKIKESSAKPIEKDQIVKGSQDKNEESQLEKTTLKNLTKIDTKMKQQAQP